MRYEADPSFDHGDDDALMPLDLYRYLDSVRRRRWPIAALVAVAVTIAVLHTRAQVPIYSAAATVLLDPSPPKVLANGVEDVVPLGAAPYWSTIEYYNAQLAILTSLELARETVQIDDVFRRMIPDGDDRSRISAAAGELAGALSVARNEGDPIVRIMVSHRDPALAAALANAHVQAYIRYGLDTRSRGTEQATRWLAGELASAEDKLRGAETELFEFKRENDLLSVSLADARNLVMANIERYDTALNEVRVQRARLEAKRRTMREARELDLALSPVFEIGDSKPGRDLVAAYHEAAVELDVLAAQLGERHPQLIEQQRKLNGIRKAMAREADRLIAAVDAEYRATVDTEATYQRQLEDYKQQAFALGPKEVDFNRLVRREASDEQRFGLLMQRMGEVELAGRLQASNIRTLDPAIVPGAPISHLRRNALLAAAAALVLGIMLSLLLDHVDRSVTSAAELERAAVATVLGVIPAIGDSELGADGDRDLLVFERPTSAVAECCRAIRTSLMFSGAGRRLKTLVIASPQPREGKTTAAIYLAAALAQSGQRVLLVDSDMRRPRLHGVFGSANGVGLSTLILGETELEDTIKTTDLPNLRVMPCGPIPPNPAELLMTSRFAEIIAQLGERFDRIILDSPPALMVTDALVLAKHADGVVGIFRAGSSLKSHVAKLAAAFARVDAPLTGVVLNGVALGGESYGYYYHDAAEDVAVVAAADAEAG
jgi:capsular exopolysaccharide synthesis family protein